MNISRQIARRASNLCRISQSSRIIKNYPVRFTPQQYVGQNVSFCPTQTSLVNQQSRLSSSASSCKFEVINVQDEEDFKKRVLESDRPIVVDFHATWCGPCKLLGPRLEKLLADYDGEVLMAKVDIDENSDIAMDYGVRSVPTVLGMKNGEVQDQFVGLIDDDKIENFVEKLKIC